MRTGVVEKLSTLRQRLDERVSLGRAKPGLMVGWRTPGGEQYGVVVGTDKQDLLVGVAYDKSLKNDVAVKLYRDEALSEKLTSKGSHGIRMDIHRVPAKKAYAVGSRVVGPAFKPYQKMSLAIESRDSFARGLGKLNEIAEMLELTECECETVQPSTRLEAILARLFDEKKKPHGPPAPADIQKTIARYYDDVRKQYPNKSKEYAARVAWTRFCKYKNPDHPSCTDRGRT